MDDPQVQAVLHSQKIARRIGHNQLAVEVFGWTIKHAVHIPTEAMKELMDIVAKEPA
jgi:hypothetical protein